MKIEGFEEISKKEYYALPDEEGLCVWSDYDDKEYYFEKLQKFPIVFEDDSIIIEVESDLIRMIDKSDEEVTYCYYKENFPLLVKAVEKAKEVMKK